MAKKPIALILMICLISTLFVLPVTCIAAENIAFYDDFEQETDTIPNNWKIYENGYNQRPGLAVVSCGGQENNKFMRLTAVDGGVAPIAVTKAGKLSLSLKEGIPVRISMRLRVNDVQLNNARNSVRLNYPSLSGSTPYHDSDANDYTIFSLRDKVFQYLNGNYKNTQYSPTGYSDYVQESDFAVKPNVWYDITAVLNPAEQSAEYTVGNRESGYRTYVGTLSGSRQETQESLFNLAVKMVTPSVGDTIDVDDVSVGYLPQIRSFFNDFEHETVNQAPADWFEENGVARLKIKQESSGNRYVRVERPAGVTTKKPPKVTLRSGLLHIRLRENNGKAVVVETKIRPQSINYGSMLMLGAPYGMTAEQHDNHEYALCLTEKTTGTYQFLGGEGFVSWKQSGVEQSADFGRWFHYKGIWVPDSNQILHYINGQFVARETLSEATSQLTEMERLTNISFTWLQYTATSSGYMDFDDVHIYELSTLPSVQVSYTNTVGPLAEMTSGAVGTRFTVESGAEDGADNSVFYMTNALYTKTEKGHWQLTKAEVQALTPQQWHSVSMTSSLMVTDSQNQKIKTYIWWNDTLQPISEAFMLPAKSTSYARHNEWNSGT